MNDSAIERWARRLVVPLATAFFVIMFFDWHEASVNVSNLVDVHAGTSAWHGWGAVAGFAAAGIVLWKFMRGIGAEIADRLSDELVTATLAAGTLVFTVVELVTGTAAVNVVGTVAVTTADRWPAYVALGLAAALAFFGLAPFGRQSAGRGGTLRAGMS
jgi:hypothetical protein